MDKEGKTKRKNEQLSKQSIHFLYPLNPTQGRGEAGTGRQPITGPHRDKQSPTLTLTPKDNLESPINLTCMFLDGGRKPEDPERTHADTGRTCRLHTERTSWDSNQDRACCEGTVLTYTPLCSLSKQCAYQMSSRLSICQSSHLIPLCIISNESGKL